MANFWKNLHQQLDRSLIGLAPMDGVTDQPFRYIVQKYGQPDVIFTEFTHVEGLCHNAQPLLQNLLYDNSQRPIVAQIYGKDPNSFRQAAVLVCQLGFDGIDLNMGCPSKSVAGGGAGAGLIQTPSLAQAIIKATQQGVQDWAGGKTVSDCPDFNDDFVKLVKQQRHALSLTSVSQLQKREPVAVSVKTRLGYDQPQIENWIPKLLEMQPAALSLHGRTLKQGYKGSADWQLITQVAQLAKHIHPDIIFLGNGDVTSYQQAVQRAQHPQIDGVLIARAAQGNPFVFNSQQPLSNLSSQQQAQLLAQVALEHAQLYEQTFCHDQEDCYFLPMRKHLAWYIKGIPHASEIRQKLVRSYSSQEVEEIFRNYQLLPALN